MKAHIGSKILTSNVQDSHNNIQPASASNSASNSDSDSIEHIVGSSSDSWKLNDPGDQAADSEQELKLKKRLDTDGKGHESSETTMCHGIIYM